MKAFQNVGIDLGPAILIITGALLVVAALMVVRGRLSNRRKRGRNEREGD